MPRIVNYTLKPSSIDAAKPREKPYTLTDGGGLFIEVLPSGGKVWRFKYHFEGRREKVTLGNYPAIGVRAARDEHERLRQLVDLGQSPAAAKRAPATPSPESDTFQSFARVYVDEVMGHMSDSYRAQAIRYLDTFINPHIGSMPLRDVLPDDVLRIIEPLRDNPSTAERVRGTIQRVYSYAIRKLRASSNPAAILRGVIVVPPPAHYRHLSEQEMGRFWRSLHTGAGGTHAGTVLFAKMLALTMVRKSELRLARWREFDLTPGAEVWEVPSSRMKMRRGHRVFLSRQVVELLRELAKLTFRSDLDGYLFPQTFSGRGGSPMSEVAINHFFGRLDFGVPEFAPHGLRGTAATLLREHGFGRDVVELLLAHQERSQSAAAYSHHELAGERRRALQFLADRYDSLGGCHGPEDGAIDVQAASLASLLASAT